jgi:C4-dicarboxylate transporter DctM subunit
MLATLFISLLVLMFFNVPIAASIGFASFASLAVGQTAPLLVVIQRMFTGLDSTVLLAIPMFIFAGRIMSDGGISKRIIDLSYSVVGWIPGSLGIVTVFSCMFFAAISGSAPATVAAIGGIMVPAMIDDGYPAGFAAALVAAGGVIGCIIPPSIPFVNYGLITGVSVGDLFMSGFVPGVMMGLALIIPTVFLAVKNKWGRNLVKFDFIKFFIALKNSILGILMPVIILGGIYSGVFTPTEAAAVACIYGIIVAIFLYKEIKFKDLPNVTFDSAKTAATILFIVATANSFAYLISTLQVPQMLTEFVTSITTNKYIILLLINIILLINGCFMEETATTFIYTPMLFPLVTAVGVNPIHFGTIMVMNMTIGLITPPLGINLFVAQGLDKRATFSEICKNVVPLFIGETVILFLVTYIPDLALWLVNFYK